MVSFVLNLPYTVLGIFFALYLIPKEVSFHTKPYRILFRVKRDTFGIDFLKGWRGMVVGHTIILNPREELKDLEHEIIHVLQYERMPFIFPVFYYIELWRYGYRNNKYENEAYDKSGNLYRGKEVVVPRN